MSDVKPRSYIYRYMDPMSGRPVWRSDNSLWNGQRPTETEALYSETDYAALEAENAILKQMWWDANDVTDLAGTIVDLESKLAKVEVALSEIQRWLPKHIAGEIARKTFLELRKD